MAPELEEHDVPGRPRPRPRQKPLSRDTAKAMFLELLETGELQVNTPLSERVLAERMGLSRTPVREALQELALEGVVTLNPTRGACINPITLDELRNLYEVRLSLETVAAYRTAELGDLSELEVLFTELEGVGPDPSRPETMSEAQLLGERLHMLIIDAASNDYLRSIYRGLRSKIQFSRFMTRGYSPQRVMAAHSEHLEILSLILKRMPAEAQTVMDSHLRRSFQTRLTMFSQLTPAVRKPLQA